MEIICRNYRYSMGSNIICVNHIYYLYDFAIYPDKVLKWHTLSAI